MFLYFKILAPSILVLLITACGNNSSESKLKEAKNKKADTATTSRHIVQKEGAIKDETLQAVYLKYNELTESLTQGNSTKARIASNAIEAGANQLSGGRKLASLAANITATSDLKTQRTYYAALSNEMISLVKQSGIREGEIYIDFCPMALNDKGAYWLSAIKEIRNPYMGEEMLTCGEIKDTMK